MKKHTPWNTVADSVDLSKKNKIKSSNITISEKLSLLRNINPLKETYNDMFDPFLMNDMDAAVEKILSCVKNNKKILIYGDYDCDGIFSTISLYKFLKTLTPNCEWFIPDRFSDGYGLTMDKCFYILENNYDLVITVDCGATSLSEVAFLMDAGISVIVTDHHTCLESLPQATAVIDCKRSDNSYPFSELCGAGVALKVIQAICCILNLGDVWKDYIEYTCIATVADVVSLTSENRIIVAEGLNAIKTTKKESIRALLKTLPTATCDIKSTDIAFSIAPKINAASRMGNISVAMDLFLSDDADVCLELSEKLIKLNEQRKEIESSIIRECYSQIIDNYDFNSYSPIILYRNGWHQGVLGIVAAKISDTFGRPTIVLSKNNDSDTYSGSCRSFKNINIYNLLSGASKYIEKFGGHAKAAGVSIKESNMENFITEIKRVSRETLDESDFSNFEIADFEVNLSDFSLDEVRKTYALGPFGEGNQEPVFIAKNLTIKKIDILGSKNKLHAKLNVFDGKKRYDIVCFSLGYCTKYLSENDVIDILFKVNIHSWHDKDNIQFLVKDIHSEQFLLNDNTFEDENILFIDDIVSIDDIIEECSIEKDILLPDKKTFSLIYFAIKDYFKNFSTNGIIYCDISSLIKYISNVLHIPLNIFKVCRVLEVLNEANYIDLKFISPDKVFILLNDNENKILLGETHAFKKMFKIKEGSKNNETI